MADPIFAVIGAGGHTGRFVVNELRRRRLRTTPIVRREEHRAEVSDARVVEISDAAALGDAIAGSFAVINCAGPFIDTAQPVVTAALWAGAHYLDISAEQASVQALFDGLDSSARERAVTVVPAMGFFGGLADLLVASAMRDWAEADQVTIHIGLDSWLPTSGTRKTGARNTAPRLIISSGRLSPLEAGAHQTKWRFPEPLGEQRMVALPFSEMPLIARRARARNVWTGLNAAALNDVRDPTTPAPTPVDSCGRSAQRFVVDVIVSRGDETRQVRAAGQDIYAVSAPLVCEAAERLASGGAPVGVRAPAEIFDARRFLTSLGSEAVAISAC